MFIVFEGSDNVGKTTQVKLLQFKLTSLGFNVVRCSFPNRRTVSGRKLSLHYKHRIHLTDREVHALYETNRQESMAEINLNLRKGHVVISDRYVYSSIAVSVAKGLDYDWCRTAHYGTIEPHLVIHLDLEDLAVASTRGQYASNRRRLSFRKKVKVVFDRIAEEHTDNAMWRRIKTDKLSVDEVRVKVLHAIVYRDSSSIWPNTVAEH